MAKADKTIGTVISISVPVGNEYHTAYLDSIEEMSEELRNEFIAEIQKAVFLFAKNHSLWSANTSYSCR